jgi:glutathione S-transferase
MYRVYGMASSGNCYKVYLALKQLGLPFEWIETDIMVGASRTAEFLAMNPNGGVPTLEIEPGKYLPESNAILSYLAEGTPLLPSDRYERAQVLRWLFYEQYNHEPNIAVARFIIHFLGNPPARRAQLAICQKRGQQTLDLMEKHLSAHDYFVANRYTIADIALYAYTHVAETGGFELGKYPAIGAWLARVKAQPGHAPMEERPAAQLHA